MFDLISIGDARVDNYYFIEDAQVLCRRDTHSCEICLGYGDKVPVQTFRQQVAGNNTNNVIGSTRLGLKSAMYGHIGKDATGQHVLDVLKKEEVSTRYIQVVKGAETENSAVINFQGERTILVYHQPWEYQLPDLDRAKWIYFSSVSYSFSKTDLIKQLEQYIERTGANLVFAPGTYQLKYGVKKLTRLLSLTRMFICNLEEARVVLGHPKDKETAPKKLLKELADLGPKMIVITDAKNGSYCFDGERFWKMDVFPAKLLEMTGSGDAFATGVLAGLFHGKPLSEAMRWGAANGASVVEQVGPQAGLLTFSQMQQKLKENSKIVAKELK